MIDVCRARRRARAIDLQSDNTRIKHALRFIMIAGSRTRNNSVHTLAAHTRTHMLHDDDDALRLTRKL